VRWLAKDVLLEYAAPALDARVMSLAVAGVMPAFARTPRKAERVRQGLQHGRHVRLV